VPPLVSAIRPSSWPVRSSLGVFGKKWTLPIIRDLYLLGEARFSDLVSRNQGMSERILSLRLRDLKREGLVERHMVSGRTEKVSYRLTGRGLAAVPILESFVQFGLMQLAADVFGPGGPPRGDVKKRKVRKTRYLRRRRPR